MTSIDQAKCELQSFYKFLHLSGSFLELAENSENTLLWDRIVTWWVEDVLKAFSDLSQNPDNHCVHLWDIRSEKIWQREIYAQYQDRSVATSWPKDKV